MAPWSLPAALNGRDEKEGPTEMSDTPIRIRPAARLHVVRAGGAVLAESDRAMLVEHGDDDPVVYLPVDADSALFLERTDDLAEIPGIGEVRRLHILAKSGAIRNAAWTVESPAPGAEQLEGLTAFDPGRVAVEEL